LKVRIGAAALFAVAFLLILTGCSPQPAQDYAVAGTLKFRPTNRFDLRNLGSGRFRLELTMTARTSPDVSDVVAQRRWVNLTPNHVFGLGKLRGTRLAKQHDKLWLTALIAVIDERSGQAHQTWVGWTPEPVDLGRYDVELIVDRLVSEADPKQPGHPTGGWFSPSVVDEAPPPGQESFDPGPRVFSGSIDLDLPEEQAQLRKTLGIFPLYVFARPRLRGPPALVTRYELPIYPVRFALHQNHRVDGTSEPVTEPMFVEVILDIDGNVGTKDDQVRVASTEAVAPLSDDLRFEFKTDDLRKLLQSRFGDLSDEGESGSTSRPSTAPNRPGAAPRAVAAGQIVVEGEAPEDAVLWLTVKCAGKTRLTKKLDPRAGFPLAFDLTEADNAGGGRVIVDEPFVVTAVMAETKDGGRRWRASSSEQPQLGARALTLRLVRE
jgi:hypothetical protein